MGLLLLGLGGLVLLVGGWVSWRTYQAYTHLQVAAGQLAQLQNEVRDVTSIDLEATNATVDDVQHEAAAAQAAASDPFYRAAAALPWVGPNLHAIGEVASTVDSLATDVLPSLVQIATTLNPAEMAPKNDVIDLTPIEAAAPLLQKADSAVNAARTRLAAIDRSKLVGPVGAAVLKLWSKLDSVSATTGTGARVGRLLPPMLGSAGPRTYLVVFQNLAETRATGGIFGSFATVRVDRGKITVIDRGRASKSIGTFTPPIQQLDSTTTALWGHQMGVFPQDVNLTPDFPTAAGLFAKMYTARKGTRIDGVVATDPVALSYALAGTGPISVGDGVTLTSKTIVPVLLSTAYAKFQAQADQTDRDAFLADATTRAFSKVLSGNGNAGLIMAGLRQAAAERRVLVWSAHPTEQSDIGRTGLAGRLSVSVENPSIGVFLNDATMAKLDYYLTNSVTVTPGDCRSDGRRLLKVTIGLSYDAPTSGLPAYVLGYSALGRRYVLRTDLMVFAPVGGGVVDAVADGRSVAMQRGESRSREVGQLPVTLSPGGSILVTFTVLAPVSTDSTTADQAPALVLTPGVHPWTTSVEPVRRCG